MLFVTLCPFKFYNRLDGEERAGYFAWIVFLVSRDGCVALPRGGIGLSAVCVCGIFLSYPLTIFLCLLLAVPWVGLWSVVVALLKTMLV